LFPDITPEIQFDQEAGRVAGNSGCNGYQAPYSLDGSGIRFGEPGPSTLMYCGEGENLFRESMRLVDQWEVDRDGKLVLLQEGQPVLRFRMKNP
jgi:heat shock protein HslJ